jgi:hypothetical protein
MDLSPIFNLLIALVAIDFTLYGIGIPYFQSQLGVNIRYLQKRLGETREKIKKLSESDKDARDNLENMQKTINNYKEEETNLFFKLFFLSYKGAVLLPLLFFSISLILIIIKQNLNLSLNFLNINISYDNTLFLDGVEILIIISLLVGVYLELVTLKSIDFAVKSIPLPIFDVTFDESKKSLDIDGGIKQIISLNITNVGYDVAELVDIMVFIDPQFEIIPTVEDSLLKQDSNASIYPNYIGVMYSIEYLHIDTTSILDFVVVPPNKIEKYNIGVFINEKKNTESQVELELNVNKTTIKIKKRKNKKLIS